MMLATLPVELNQATDVVTIVGSVATVMRSGSQFWRGDLRPISTQLTGMLFASQLHSNRLVWEPIVANRINVITKIQRNLDGSYDIEWDNSGGMSFPDLEVMQSWAGNVVTDDTFSKKLSLAVALSISPDGTGLASLVGTKVSISTDARGNECTVEVPPQ
jgi:hypothetical protein